LRFQNEKGLILIDILIVILIAGIIAAIVVPQYTQKQEKEQMELSQQNMDALANAQDTYFQEKGKYASDIMELSSVDPDVRDILSPGGLEYSIELPDSLSYVILCPQGYGEIRADSTGIKRSWEK
jgi:type IV pilus assembly protein PilE